MHPTQLASAQAALWDNVQSCHEINVRKIVLHECLVSVALPVIMAAWDQVPPSMTTTPSQTRVYVPTFLGFLLICSFQQ